MFNERVSFNKTLESIVDEINTELSLVGDEKIKTYFNKPDFLEFPAIVCSYIISGDPEMKTDEISDFIQLSLFIRENDVMLLTKVMKRIYQKFGFVKRNVNGWVKIQKKDYEPCIDPAPVIDCMRLSIERGWTEMFNPDKEIQHYKLDLMLYYDFD